MSAIALDDIDDRPLDDTVGPHAHIYAAARQIHEKSAWLHPRKYFGVDDVVGIH